MQYNIFQGNEQLDKIVAKTLGYEYPQKYSFFTQDIYFEAFFYLSKRFGQPKIQDEYKDAGIWDFKVKKYIIRIYLNTSWVSFMIFGESGKNKRWSKNNYQNYCSRTPAWVKTWRKMEKKKHLLIHFGRKKTKRSEKLEQKVFQEFCKINSIDETWTQERWDADKEMKRKYFEYLQKYNEDIIGVDRQEYNEKYGFDYKNSKTKHALKTLRQFIQNMLTPISIRDCNYNIKGQCGCEFDKYIGNIKIDFQSKKR
jgi:hypothetical protein